MARALHIIDRRTPVDLLRQLNQLAGEDDMIVSIGPSPQFGEFSRPVRAVHCPLGIAPLATIRMRKIALQVDIIHAWSFSTATVAGMLARCHGLPAVLSLTGAPARIQAPSLRRLAKKGVEFIVPTRAAKRSLNAALPGAAVHVVPAPAEIRNAANFAQRRSAIRETMGVSEDDHLIVVPAEMVMGAGHKYASWAHAIVRHIRDGVRLWLPGGGPVSERVRTFAHATGWDSDIFFAGEQVALCDALIASDVAMFPAEQDVGISALATAMACGSAIIASDLPGMAECAPDEQAALLAPRRDPRALSAALLRMIEEPGLPERLGQAAQRRAEELFDPGKSRQALLGVYAAARPA